MNAKLIKTVDQLGALKARISKLQETETRQAFFAGCLVAINVVADGIRNHAPVDAVKNIKALRAEADAVCKQRIYEIKERN